MMDDLIVIKEELRRIDQGPFDGEKPFGYPIKFAGRCSTPSASVVLERARTVMRLLDQATLNGWPENETINIFDELPSYFTSACAPERTQEEIEEDSRIYKLMSNEEKIKDSRTEIWTLNAWLFWLRPEDRPWYWWDSKIDEEQNIVIISVVVDGWPYASGALRWLLRGCGADSVDDDEYQEASR